MERPGTTGEFFIIILTIKNLRNNQVNLFNRKCKTWARGSETELWNPDQRTQAAKRWKDRLLLFAKSGPHSLAF